MVSTRERKNHREKQLSQLNKTLNDFVIGSETKVSVIENEALQLQIDGRYNNPERIVDGGINARQIRS